MKLRSICKSADTWVLVCAVLVALPSLNTGLFDDDLWQRRFVLDHLHGARQDPWWNMFGSPHAEELHDMIRFGVLPWWTSEHFQLSFFRPLAVATHYLDYRFWPDCPALMHLQNVAIYALLCLGVSRLYARMLGAGATATVASILYALDDTHLEAVAWLSARNSIMTALFCTLSLTAFDAAAVKHHKKQALLASALLALAHFSSEGAVAVWAYVIGRIVCERSTFAHPARTALSLGATVTASFSIFTHLARYRVVGSGAYIDPRVRPAEFASVVPERLVELMREQFGAPRWLSDWVAGTPLELPLQVATLFTLSVLAALAGGRFRRDSRLQSLGVGMLGSAIIVCGVRPEPRLLLMVGVGAHALLAVALTTAMHAVRQRSRPTGRLIALLAGGIALLLHAVAPLFASATVSEWYRSRHRNYAQAAASMQIDPSDSTRTVVILQAPSYFDALSTCMYRVELGLPSWRSVHIVGVSQGRVKMRRTEEQAVVLEPEHGYLLEKTSQQARSPDEPFVAGEVTVLDQLAVVVEAVTPTGRPRRLRLELGANYEDRLRFLTWNPSRQTFDRVAMPPIGEWREL